SSPGRSVDGRGPHRGRRWSEATDVAGALTSHVELTAREVDHRGGLHPYLTGVDDRVEVRAQQLMDLPALGRRILTGGKQQGRGDDRGPERIGEGGDRPW